MEDASKARRSSCTLAMVKLIKPSVTKLLDTHIYIAHCSDIIYDPEVLLHSHVTDALLGISAFCVIIIHPLLQAVDISWWLMRDKKGRGFRIRQYSFLLSDTESIKNLSLCPASKCDIFIKSGSLIIPHIKSADSYKVEICQFSPSELSPLPS